MPKTYKPREVVAKLKKLGFVEDRQKGSHKILYHPISGRRAVVPFHIKELPKGTMVAIIKEANISKEEFDKT